VAKGKTTRIGEPIYLAREDRAHAVSFTSPADREVVVTNPAIPGLELHIPKGAVIRTPDGKIVTKLSITPLPINRAPFPVPMSFPVYFSVQPAGAFVDNSGSSEVLGIRVLYPNYINAPPGTRVVFWNYDPNGTGWQVYGGGSVSADGQKVVPDEGVTQATMMAFGYGLENNGNAPEEGPPPGCCEEAGDPVNLATGLFLHRSVDLFVSDTIPLVVNRTYRQNDSKSRDFGIGSNHVYGMFLSNPGSDVSTPPMIDLILPDGGRVRFNKISGSAVTDVVFEHTSTPTEYQGAQLRVNTATTSWEMTLKDRSILRFQRHAPNALIAMQNRSGNVLTINRVNDRISQIVSPHGRTLSFAYDSSARVKSVIDSIGRTFRYEYDSGGRLWKATDPNGKVEQYGYDSANRMTTVTDRRGNVMVTNLYDANGRVQQQTLADSAVWLFSYVLGANGKVTQTDVTDPRGVVRRLLFNSAGYLTQQTLALGEPEQRTTQYVREPITNLGTSVTDFLGRVTKFEYDYRGNLTTLTRLFGTPGAVTESFEYEPVFGELTAYTDPLNHKSLVNYDIKGNVASVSNALGHTSLATYDAEGRISSFTSAIGKTTQLSYDLGDLATVTNPLSQTVTLLTDAVGRTTSYVDAAGRSARVVYDVLDRPVEQHDALGQTARSTYDENSNRLSFRDPRDLASHVFAYDVRNRIHTYTDPLGEVETYGYDGLGNVTSVIDRKGQTTTLQYDALNRMKSVTYGDSSSVTVTYDDANRTVTYTDSVNGAITQIYDDLGRLVRESGPEGRVDYQYDLAGRRTHLTVQGIATPVTYQYDIANRLIEVAQGGVVTGFGYDAANRRTTTTLPNAIVSTWAYNDANEVTSINFDKGGIHVGDLTYSYDSAGRRTGVTGSLAKLITPPTVNSATYDAANRLTNWGAAALSYDDNGNMTSSGSVSYGWNARDQLESASLGSSTFSYDGLGRRRSRSVSGITTSYLHDGVNPVTVAGDVMLAGGGVDEFHAQSSAGVPGSYLTDAIGNVLALTDGSGAVVAGYSYGAYGQVAKTGSGEARFQFTGRERDVGSLQYNRARYYDSDLGRFISEDPIGLDGGINTYSYAGENPVSFVDPFGEVDSLPQGVVDFFAGFGDGISGGLTRRIRGLYDGNNSIDRCSAIYRGAEWSGIVAGLAVPVGRATYVYKVSQLPRSGMAAEQIVNTRNALKAYFRGRPLDKWLPRLNPRYGYPTLKDLLEKNDNNLARIIERSGVTSPGWTLGLVGGGGAKAGYSAAEAMRE
jgi:RHS repeat-associated protein